MSSHRRLKNQRKYYKKGADHNGSTGLYYSFGNKGAMCENEQR